MGKYKYKFRPVTLNLGGKLHTGWITELEGIKLDPGKLSIEKQEYYFSYLPSRLCDSLLPTTGSGSVSFASGYLFINIMMPGRKRFGLARLLNDLLMPGRSCGYYILFPEVKYHKTLGPEVYIDFFNSFQKNDPKSLWIRVILRLYGKEV